MTYPTPTAVDRVVAMITSGDDWWQIDTEDDAVRVAAMYATRCGLSDGERRRVVDALIMALEH